MMNGENDMAKSKVSTAKKMKVKTEKSAEKLSKSLKAQIHVLIEKATKGIHKSLAKLEKQLGGAKKPATKAKAATKPKKKTARKKKTEIAHEAA